MCVMMVVVVVVDTVVGLPIIECLNLQRMLNDCVNGMLFSTSYSIKALN